LMVFALSSFDYSSSCAFVIDHRCGPTFLHCQPLAKASLSVKVSVKVSVLV
jgi:hypothetical protein